MTKSVFTKEYEVFRLLLKQERLKAKLTQKQLSSLLNMPNSFVCKYEQGERRIDIVEFIQIARVIGFDPCKIISELLTQLNIKINAL